MHSSLAQPESIAIEESKNEEVTATTTVSVDGIMDGSEPVCLDDFEVKRIRRDGLGGL